MYVFGGSASPQLATSVATLLHAAVGNVQRKRFPNGEQHIRIDAAAIGKEAVIIQSLSSPVEEHLVEFCLLADSLQRMGVTHLYGVIPWLGYSKQNKVFMPGEALSLHVIAKILQVVPLKKLFFIDVHATSLQEFFDIPVIELSAQSVFASFLKDKTEPEVIVAPDKGAKALADALSKQVSLPVAYIDKQRDLVTGKVTVTGLAGDVQEKNIVIVDDMIVTGDTICESASYLKAHGARDIRVVVTHHLRLEGVQEKLIRCGISQVVTTDTIESVHQLPDVTVCSVSSVIAHALTQNLS